MTILIRNDHNDTLNTLGDDAHITQVRRTLAFVLGIVGTITVDVGKDLTPRIASGHLRAELGLVGGAYAHITAFS